jgi:hypothetical protein
MELAAAKRYIQIVTNDRLGELDESEREELLGDGLELYTLGLRGRRLGDRLIDRYRARHPGSRSENPPPRSEPVPGTLSDGLVEEDFERRLESYQAALIFRGEADLGDPRLMGKFFGGVPSAAVVPTGQREGVWDSVQREREEFGQILAFEFRSEKEIL